MKRGSLFACLLALLAVAVPATARWGLSDPVTERARLIEGIYVQIVIAGVIVFAFVMVLLAYILIRYRDGGKGRATYEKERDNLKAEMVWTVIPLVIMLWIGVISYQGLVELDNLDGSFDFDEALVIDITASQYAWQASYESTGVNVLAVANDDLEAIDPFYIPENTPLWIRLTAVDVLHALNVPLWGVTTDAVPGQINDILIHDGVPAGWYFTQCKEICKTPGHSYMQAQFIAVPQAEYDEWTEETLAGAGAGLEQVVPLLFDENDVFAPMKGDQLAQGATAFVQVLYNGTAPTMDFTYGGETRTVNRGALTTFEFPVDELGAYTFSAADGQSVDLTGVAPTVIDVDLGAFVIEPGSLELDAGTLYILNVQNVHNAVHNLYIGMNGADGEVDAIWNTGNLIKDQSEGLLVDATEAMSLDMWCAVPGHYSAGMFGSVTVA